MISPVNNKRKIVSIYLLLTLLISLPILWSSFVHLSFILGDQLLAQQHSSTPSWKQEVHLKTHSSIPLWEAVPALPLPSLQALQQTTQRLFKLNQKNSMSRDLNSSVDQRHTSEPIITIIGDTRSSGIYKGP